MQFTQPKITEILSDLAKSEIGINTVLKLAMEAIMKSERAAHNETCYDLSNGFRSRRPTNPPHVMHGADAI